MLNLSNVGGSAPHKIRLTTGQAITVDVHASYVDLASGVATPGSLNTLFTTATTTDIVAAPASGAIRNVKTLNVRNRHATATVDITIYIDITTGTTLVELLKVTLGPGQTLVYIEGVGWYTYTPALATTLFKILAADDAGGQNVATAQPWFPTAGAVTVAADTTYLMDGRLMISRAAGSTSHTTSLLFGGTATLTAISYMAKVQVGDTMALLPLSRVQAAVATATVVKAASTSTTEQITVDLEGVIRINAGGTLIPQFIYSAAPGGTPTILKGSRLVLTPVGSGSVVAQGAWA